MTFGTIDKSNLYHLLELDIDIRFVSDIFPFIVVASVHETDARDKRTGIAKTLTNCVEVGSRGKHVEKLRKLLVNTRAVCFLSKLDTRISYDSNCAEEQEEPVL